MSSPRLRAGLVIAAVAVASGIAGAAIDHAVLAHRGGRGDRDRRPTAALEQRRRSEMLEHLSHDLALTPAQRVAIDSIFQRTDSSLRAIRREMQPRLQQVFEQSRSEIDAHLDSTQRAKFARFRRPDGGSREWRGGDRGHRSDESRERAE